MQTDSYGQGIPYPTLSDKPNIQTLGQGIVDGIVPQTIMRFPSASVRNATITSPVAGMQTWLDDVTRLEVYDGEAWASVASGRTIWTDLDVNSDYAADGAAIDGTGNNDQGHPAYRIVDLFGEPAIMLRGGVGIRYSNGSPIGGKTITATALPQLARPPHLRTVPAACSSTASVVNSVKLDITTSGDLSIVGIGGSQNQPPWVSLNGVLCSL